MKKMAAIKLIREVNGKCSLETARQIYRICCDSIREDERRVFAGLAMQGICADGIPGSHHSHKQTAHDAIAHADALIKELEKTDE